MSAVQYLFDECVPEGLLGCLHGMEPAIAARAVGQPLAPPKGTPDPVLLIYTEQVLTALVTRDRNTMPDHVADHLAAGRHTWGVFILKENFSNKRLSEELILIWATSQAEEWQDRIEFIPW